MTQLLAPRAGQPARGGWQYGLDELEVAGVRLSQEQLLILEDDQPQTLMAAWPVPDPASWLNVAEMAEEPLKPLIVYDEPMGSAHRVTIPVLAETFPNYLEMCAGDEVLVDPEYSRFPSVIARIVIPGDNQISQLILPPSYLRIWDVEALLRYEQWDDVAQATELWWRYSDYALLRDYWECWANLIPACMLATRLGLEQEHHKHEVRATGRPVEVCTAGDQMFADLQQMLFWDGRPSHGAKPIKHDIGSEITFGDPSNRHVWEQLTTTSQANAEQALRVVPPWKVDALRKMEQDGGRPWW